MTHVPALALPEGHPFPVPPPQRPSPRRAELPAPLPEAPRPGVPGAGCPRRLRDARGGCGCDSLTYAGCGAGRPQLARPQPCLCLLKAFPGQPRPEPGFLPRWRDRVPGPQAPSCCHRHPQALSRVVAPLSPHGAPAHSPRAAPGRGLRGGAKEDTPLAGACHGTVRWVKPAPSCLSGGAPPPGCSRYWSPDHPERMPWWPLPIRPIQEPQPQLSKRLCRHFQHFSRDAEVACASVLQSACLAL